MKASWRCLLVFETAKRGRQFENRFSVTQDSVSIWESGTRESLPEGSLPALQFDLAGESRRRLLDWRELAVLEYARLALTRPLVALVALDAPLLRPMLLATGAAVTAAYEACGFFCVSISFRILSLGNVMRA